MSEGEKLNYQEISEKYHLLPRQEDQEENMLLSVLLVRKKDDTTALENKMFDVQIRTPSINTEYVPQNFIDFMCNQVGRVVVNCLQELRKQNNPEEPKEKIVD